MEAKHKNSERLTVHWETQPAFEVNLQARREAAAASAQPAAPRPDSVPPPEALSLPPPDPA